LTICFNSKHSKLKSIIDAFSSKDLNYLMFDFGIEIIRSAYKLFETSKLRLNRIFDPIRESESCPIMHFTERLLYPLCCARIGLCTILDLMRQFPRNPANIVPFGLLKSIGCAIVISCQWICRGCGHRMRLT
jgi:hypothetical protein